MHALRFVGLGFMLGLFFAVTPSCGAVRPCTPSNCRGCCAADGVCELGTTTGACGQNGAACVSCAKSQQCNGSCFGGNVEGTDSGTGGGLGGGTGGGDGGGAGGGTGGGTGGLTDGGSVADGGALTEPADAGPHRVFVTSAQYSGQLAGLAGADQLCQTAAIAANKGGTWKAWLSSSTVNAIDRITDLGPWYQQPSAGAWVKTFNNKANLVTSPLQRLYVDEEGRGNSVSTQRTYWTGTLQTGLHADATCSDWVSSTLQNGIVGPGSSAWSTNDFVVACTAAYALVCFEQSKLPAPSSEPNTHKRVFVTSAEYSGQLGGLAGADQLCQTAATAANKGGTWRAWLSSSTVNAIDRIADVGPWYQEPSAGALVKTFNNKANLVTSPLQRLYVDEEGRGNSVSTQRTYWTGTLQTGQHASATCNDWASSTSQNGTVGPGSSAWSYNDFVVSCTSTYSLVCLEQ